MKTWRAASAFLAVVLLLAACSDGTDTDDASDPSSEAPADSADESADESTGESVGESADAGAVAVDPISWGSCRGTAIDEYVDLAPNATFECAKIEVPIDHAGVVPGTIEVAVTRLLSSGSGAGGSLFVNPGGPGVAPAELVFAASFGVLPAELWENFDIVAVDPRGVGDSEPTFGCGPTEAIDELIDSIEDAPDTPAEIEAGELAAQHCVEEMGPVAGYLGTRDVVDDMDLVRAAMGEEQISYLGFSYGSTIGVMYATRYPDRVRSMVVDGADNVADPVDSAEDLVEETLEELEPFEKQLALALDACGTSCPFGNDPKAALRAAAANADVIEAVFEGDDDAFLAGVVGTLYDESSWPDLHQGLVDLTNGDPSTLEPYAAINLEPGEARPNITEHVNCIDGWIVDPVSRDELLALNAEAFGGGEDEVLTSFPLFQAIAEGAADDLLDLDGSSSVCLFYDTIIGERLAEPLDGGDVPIVVIGNRSDPFTPFGESQELVDEILSNGILVEVDHPRHTVYPENPCIVDIVHRALIDQILPPSGTVCGESTDGTPDQAELVCRVLLDLVGDDLAVSPPEDSTALCAEATANVRTKLGDDEVDRILASEDESDGLTLGAAFVEEFEALLG